jgi:hypothetical protein
MEKYPCYKCGCDIGQLTDDHLCNFCLKNAQVNQEPENVSPVGSGIPETDTTLRQSIDQEISAVLNLAAIEQRLTAAGYTFEKVGDELLNVQPLDHNQHQDLCKLTEPAVPAHTYRISKPVESIGIDTAHSQPFIVFNYTDGTSEDFVVVSNGWTTIETAHASEYFTGKNFNPGVTPELDLKGYVPTEEAIEAFKQSNDIRPTRMKPELGAPYGERDKTLEALDAFTRSLQLQSGIVSADELQQVIEDNRENNILFPPPSAEWGFVDLSTSFDASDDSEDDNPLDKLSMDELIEQAYEMASNFVWVEAEEMMRKLASELQKAWDTIHRMNGPTHMGEPMLGVRIGNENVSSKETPKEELRIVPTDEELRKHIEITRRILANDASRLSIADKQDIRDDLIVCEELVLARAEIARLLSKKKNEPSVTVRYDLSPAQVEGEIRSKMIYLGWAPPEKVKELQDRLEHESKHCHHLENLLGNVSATIPAGKVLDSTKSDEAFVDYFKSLHAERDDLRVKYEDELRAKAEVRAEPVAVVHDSRYEHEDGVVKQTVRILLNPLPEGAELYWGQPAQAVSVPASYRDDLDLIRAVLEGFLPCVARDDALRVVRKLLAAAPSPEQPK